MLKHRSPGALQFSEERQVPAVQLFEQQFESRRQSRPSATQAAGIWHVPLVQVSPVQQPDPQGNPSDEHVGGVWHVPLVQVSPVQQPDPQGVPTGEQVLAARQVPETQLVPSQHSPLYTQARPSVRQTQTPAEHSM